jgi:thioredoxin-like negative regulator of GroEL
VSTFSPTEISSLLQRGIAAARSGRSGEAQHLLQKVVKADSNNEMAWLWLSGLMATHVQKRACLEQVLRVNPENIYARASLARLQDRPVAKTRELEACVNSIGPGTLSEQLLKPQRENHKQRSNHR